MRERSDKTMSRAKHVLSGVEGSAKDAKVDFDKKRWNGRGLCELSVLGAINFLAVVLFNISRQESRLAHSVHPENCVVCYHVLSRLSSALLRRHSILLVAKLGMHTRLFLILKNLPELFLSHS